MNRIALVALLLFAASPLSAAPPDIVMIAIDDLRPTLGCYGDRRIHSPHIDRLAQQGVVFERAYCQYAKCGTSRLSLLTGLRPDAIGVFSNAERDVASFRERRPDALSVARWLKQHGYHTQSFGKIYHDGWDAAEDWSVPSRPGRVGEMWEIVNERDPQGPTRIAERLACPVVQSPEVDDSHLFAGRMTDEVVRVIRKPETEQPFFLAVGYRRPHLPFVAPQRYFDLYEPDKTWLPQNTQPPLHSPVISWFNSDGYVGTARRLGVTMPNPPSREQAIAWNGFELRSYLGVPTHGEIDESLSLQLLHAYAACVSYVDAQIGRLLSEIERSPRFNNAYIVLWSDHGWHLGEQSAWGKMTNFELATRVPLVIAGPGINPGRTQSLAELVDLYPTLCGFAGVPVPPHLEGESLLPAVRDPEATFANTALSQYARFREQYTGYALRTDRYRFIRWRENKSNRVVGRELYDHDSDPHETTNLDADPQHGPLVSELDRLLDDLLKSHEDRRGRR